ncbi:MAG: hypothetical protein FWD26_04390 [Treponema sp.]|nr:hypothetical protein [Treponema sp.]
MPTYEYECKSCSHNFEVFQSMKDQPIEDCPKCNKEVRRIIFGGAGVIFKGSGFYVTDKSKAATQGVAQGAAQPKKPESCAQCTADSGKCPAAETKTESKTA